MVLSIRPAGVLFMAILSVAGAASGQPPPQMGPRAWNLVRFAGENEVTVRTTWAPDGQSGEVMLLAAGRGSIALYRGGRAITAVATSGATVLAAITEIDGARTHLVLVDLATDGPPRRLTTESPGGSAVTPSAVVATSDDRGFTVLWQGIVAAQFRAARTAMMRIGRDGEWIERPRQVEVPWALADVAWNGRGYHVALYFDGQSPNETRLCMVTLSAAGVPEQHPWWASRPGLVDEARLVRVGDRIVAIYRAGETGTELRRRDVTEPGVWGNDGGPGALVGRIARGEEMLVRVADGSVRVERRAF